MQLAAQAEAERQNIGTADYLHRQLDKEKQVVEDHEQHHIEFNKYISPSFLAMTEAIRVLSALSGHME